MNTGNIKVNPLGKLFGLSNEMVHHSVKEEEIKTMKKRQRKKTKNKNFSIKMFRYFILLIYNLW